MNKIKYFIILLVLPFTLASCNDWLNVSPEDEIGEEELFASGEGYRNALNGVYKVMAESGLYGRNLTWGLADGMGQYYTYDEVTDNCHDIEYAADYDFKDEYVKPQIKTIWEKAYNAVANCNNIIQNIENDDPEKFEYKEEEREMIWGEALALRAFIQFDMLRLFAAAPVAKPTKAYIPYINVYPSYVSKKLTVDECLKYIIDDLKAAKPLVARRDTVMDFSSADRLEVVKAGSQRFLYSRGYRLNYYAISALLARVYLYAEKKDEAYSEALALIKVQESKRYFSFEGTSDGGRKMFTDVIAAYYVPKLTEWDALAYDFTDPSEYYWQYLALLDVETLYAGDVYYDDNEEVNTSRDYRYKDQIQKVGSDYITLKNQRSFNTERVWERSNTMMPLIRMSEVYYIASEALAEKDLAAAKEYLFTVKSGRGLRSSRITELRAQITTVPLLRAALLNDARREFVCEGQMFFMHKRMGEQIPAEDGALIPTTEEKMVLPLPDSEISIK